MKKILFIFYISILLFSCNEEIETFGDLEIMFKPTINSNHEESNYCYLYTNDGFDRDIFLKKINLYDDSVYDIKSGKNITSIYQLNPGDYIFKYYKSEVSQVFQVQVIIGEKNHYDFD